MFTGHYSAALLAATHPKAPCLGTLFVAAQLVDIGFFMFVPLGIEHMRVAPGTSAMNPMDLYDLPWTHSLLGTASWAVGFALIARAIAKNTSAGTIAGLVVLSHWLLDYVVHVPDLTIAGVPPKLGLGLWNHPTVAMPLEFVLLMSSAMFYALRTRPSGKTWLLLGLILLLLALQAINWFGPPPARVDAGLWGSALIAFALATAMASWVARNRVPR